MRGGRERIRLFYFPETKNDVDAYFTQAVRIKRLQERYSYPSTAMDSILNACKEDVDIERYKTHFYIRLRDLHITEYSDEIDFRRNQDYLFEKKDFEEKKDKHFTPDQYTDVNNYVKIADYINILRQGKRGYPLEKCGYMFLSDGNLSNELSRFIREYYADKKPIVITRMGTFTELMWFKLRKGVVETNSSETISVVNKAKTVVSGLLYDNLKKQYDAVLAMKADDTEKKAFYADLRTKRYSPDDISSETIADDIAFIDNTDYLEKYKATQNMLKSQAAKAEELEVQLEQKKYEKDQLESKVKSLEEYVKNENDRKFKVACLAARKRIAKQRFCLKYYPWLVNILVLVAFIIPSVFCMDHNFANIATVGGTLLAVELALNSLMVKKKDKIFKYFQKRYRAEIEEEIKKQGCFFQ